MIVKIRITGDIKWIGFSSSSYIYSDGYEKDIFWERFNENYYNHCVWEKIDSIIINDNYSENVVNKITVVEENNYYKKKLFPKCSEKYELDNMNLFISRCEYDFSVTYYVSVNPKKGFDINKLKLIKIREELEKVEDDEEEYKKYVDGDNGQLMFNNEDAICFYKDKDSILNGIDSQFIYYDDEEVESDDLDLITDRGDLFECNYYAGQFNEEYEDDYDGDRYLGLYIYEFYWYDEEHEIRLDEYDDDEDYEEDEDYEDDNEEDDENEDENDEDEDEDEDEDDDE